MNKVFLGIVLAVCILGMLLVMLNDRLGRKSESVASLPATESASMQMGARNTESAAKALEAADAENAMAPPQIEEVPPFRPGEPVATLEPPAGMLAPVPQQREPEIPPPASAPQRQQELLPEPAPAPAKPAPVKPTPAAPAKVEAKPAPPAKPDTMPAQQAGAAHTINRFVVYSRERGATVRIGGTSKLEYSSMTLTNPDRVVVDLPGNWKFPPNPGVPKNDLVSAVRVGKNGDKTRVVIDLKMAARKVLLVPFKSEDGVDVRLDR